MVETGRGDMGQNESASQRRAGEFDMFSQKVKRERITPSTAWLVGHGRTRKQIHHHSVWQLSCS